MRKEKKNSRIKVSSEDSQLQMKREDVLEMTRELWMNVYNKITYKWICGRYENVRFVQGSPDSDCGFENSL